jgi:hypothetical protein
MVEDMRNSPLSDSQIGTTRRSQRKKDGNAMVAEYDRINKAVYGSHVCPGTIER